MRTGLVLLYSNWSVKSNFKLSAESLSLRSQNINNVDCIKCRKANLISHPNSHSNQACGPKVHILGACCSFQHTYNPGTLGLFRSAVDMLTHPSQLCTSSPPTKSLVEVQHTDVGKVRHPGDSLQKPESFDGSLVINNIQNPTKDEIRASDDEGGIGMIRALLSFPFSVPDCVIVQCQAFQGFPDLQQIYSSTRITQRICFYNFLVWL